MQRLRLRHLAFVILIFVFGCQQEQGAYPAFMLGSADNPGSDDIQVIQDIGTNTEVQGRFLSSHQYRGFTFEAQQGEAITVQLQAEQEDDGFLTGQSIATQVLLFAPTETQGVFEEVIQDSGMVEQALVQADIEQTGTYLVAIAREDQLPAQFQLDVECPECQQGPEEPNKLCESGRLYVEGHNQRSQEWNRCEVILLEPAEILPEETLTIGPDVNVRAHYYITDYHGEGFGETKLTISGNLVMGSDADHPVVFESNVPGRQWAGIELANDGLSIHDFVLRDTHEGLRIAANDASVSGGLFTLNRVGIDITHIIGNESICPRNVSISGSKMQENDTGMLVSCVRAVEELTIQDTEATLNDIGMSLFRLQSSLLSGLNVHDNEDGLRIFNATQEDVAPENAVIIEDSVFTSNLRALTLEGNGRVTGCEITNNGEYGVLFDRTTRRQGRTTFWNPAGWTQLTNSLVAHNGSTCQWPEEDFNASYQSDLECGGVIVQRGVHAVIRNDIVRDNAGFGVVLRGETGEEARSTTTGGGDPAVLNSVIRDNVRGGIFFVDSPIFSVEYNVIESNGLTELQLGYSGRMQSLHSVREGTEYVYYYQLRNNRFEHNNIDIATALFAFTNQNITRNLVAPRQGPRLVMTNNYFDGLSAEEVTEQIDFEWSDIEPVLTSPDQMAGLVRPLDFE